MDQRLRKSPANKQVELVYNLTMLREQLVRSGFAKVDALESLDKQIASAISSIDVTKENASG